MSQKNRLLKLAHLYAYEIGAVALIACATLLRVVLNVLGWSPLNSDEAFMDLAALHIAKDGQHPIFYYGQHYLGPIEAYVGAVLFSLVEPSAFVMRMEMVAFFAAFLVCLYILTSKLYSKSFALVCIAILTLGSAWTLARESEAIGYPELPLLVALIFLTAYLVAFYYYRLSVLQRCMLYLLWGVLAGLSIWEQLLSAPYVLVSGLMILLLCRKDLLKRASWLMLLGLCIGGFPLIYYNLTAAPGQNSLDVFEALMQMGYNPQLGLKYHLVASVLDTLPVSTGYDTSCLPPTYSHQFVSSSHHVACLLVQGAWGGGYLVLVVLGLILAVLALRKASRLDLPMERHQEMTRQCARLMLLVGFVLSFVSYAHGNGLNIDALGGWRYLICTLLSLPAVLWPLWTSPQLFRNIWLQRGAWVCKCGVLLLVGMVLLYSTAMIFVQSVPATQATEQNVATLESTLEQMHLTRIYSDYWTCAVVILETQEQVICGSTDNNLAHISDRYAPYLAMVEAAPNLTFVYKDGAAQLATLNQYIDRYHIQYQRTEVPGYVIYQITGKIPTLNL